METSVSFISDQSKVKLSAGDLFDRIINLKLFCKNKKTKAIEEFVIRSDYELSYTNMTLSNFIAKADNTGKQYLIRRCTQKPSIKVQCKMVTSNTGTEVHVFITNFFMLTKDGNYLRSFNSEDYEIYRIDIAMGYWGQFVNALLETVPTIEEYFDIRAENGADMISVTSSIVVTTDKLPPDSVLHIKGYVADILGSPVDITKVTTPNKALGQPVISSSDTIEKAIFELVTRRYINPLKVTSREMSTATFARVIQLSEATQKEFIGKVVIDSQTGQMSSEDAKKYGMTVYLSDKVKDVKIKQIYNSQGEKVERALYFEAGWTVGQTITRFMSYLDAELAFSFTNKGDLLIYTPDEIINNIDSLTKAYEKAGVYKDTVLQAKDLYDRKLPAVYNINIDSVATITCPFFTFIEPFQYVEFASRYALTSLVSYFASYSPNIYKFLVINANVSFATVEEVNEVQMTAVSAKDYE